MSEDSTSDEEWHEPAKRLEDDENPAAKCWECGETFSDIKSLMSHYKSHNIKATCHICGITFRRLTSLSMHLNNAHVPPLCRKCNQYFSSSWELNKHAETQCTGSPFQKAPSLISAPQNCDNFPVDGTAQRNPKPVHCYSLSELTPQQIFKMKPERATTSETSVANIVGEEDDDIDMESKCEQADGSSSSTTDDEDKTRDPDDPESDVGSSSSDSSSDSSHSLYSKKAPAAPAGVNSSQCAACGRGPFRSMKLHLLHCSRVRVKFQCSVCKMLFLTETSLKEHYMPLYSCEICSQVFPHENSYHLHQCPKGTKSPLVLFCSESMPQACNICKSFFTSEKTLLNHVTMVHTSVVSTKVCILTNPSALTDTKVSPAFLGTAAQSANRSPIEVNQVMNGKLCVGQTFAGSSPSPVWTSSSSYVDRSCTTISMASSAAPVGSGEGPKNQSLNHRSAPSIVPPGATDSSPAPAASDPDTPPMPSIMALFENDSQDVAMMKRMNAGWRSKTPLPCRQCGAILRQPSFIISHRYLHRGHRSHKCQCGRAFKHQLHLLRHCVRHAEAVSYICVSCGETFPGAKLLAEHMRGESRKKCGREWKRKVKRKCRMPFTCDCGQQFFRPSAYIWHQLKNRTKTKQLKKHLK